VSVFHGIECDGCNHSHSWYTGTRTVSRAALRKILRDTHGWHTVRRSGSPARDICRACWSRGKR